MTDKGAPYKKVDYLYDDRCFRLAKVVYLKPVEGDDGLVRTTWYIRDASGTILSVYEQEGSRSESNNSPLVQKEVPIYVLGKLVLIILLRMDV